MTRTRGGSPLNPRRRSPIDEYGWTKEPRAWFMRISYDGVPEGEKVIVCRMCVTTLLEDQGLLIVPQPPGASVVQWLNRNYEELYGREREDVFKPDPHHPEYPMGVYDDDRLLKVNYQCAAHNGRIML